MSDLSTVVADHPVLNPVKHEESPSLISLMRSYPFFPRGKGPLVSILIPTRGRADHLRYAVDSFWSLASNKDHLEFVFKVDNDDSATIAVVNKIAKLIPNVKIIASPRGRGYYDFHLWVNQMCEVATGDWLFLANDDCRMAVEGWDSIIYAGVVSNAWPGINDLCLLTFSTKGKPGSQEFVALRRSTYNILGHFSLSPFCDDWIIRVMSACGCILPMPVELEHFINPSSDDYFMDDTRHEGMVVTNSIMGGILAVKNIRLRMGDSYKVADRMFQVESKRVWFDYPPNNRGWVLWKASEDEFCTVFPVLVWDDNGWMFSGDGIRHKNISEVSGLWVMKE